MESGELAAAEAHAWGRMRTAYVAMNDTATDLMEGRVRQLLEYRVNGMVEMFNVIYRDGSAEEYFKIKEELDAEARRIGTLPR